MADRLLVGCLAVGVVVLAATLAGVPAEWVLPLGAVLVLLAPGYAILRAAGHRSSAPGEALASSVAVSLGATMVTGLVLHLLPGGLTRTSWSCALAGIVVAACAVAARRGTGGTTSRPGVRADLLVKSLVAAVLVVGTGAVALASQSRWAAGQRFTALSVDGTRAAPSVTIRNHEGEDVRYVLTLRVDGRRRGRRRVLVRAGASRTVRLHAGPRARNVRIALDRPGARSPYRFVDLKGGRP